ncbi:MAG: ribosome silencing factor [Eubacterium sp.]|nr:ribosome silencing factor [Eubacterium sp.]
MDSLNKLKIIYKALDDKQAIDIKMIDIREISYIADYFVIASASNINQMQAFTDNIETELIKEKIHLPKIEGKRDSSWLLIDLGDVIVNLFLDDQRHFYDLEKLWMDGKNVSFN